MGKEAKIELLSLGDNFLAHNSVSGAIVLTNEFGAGILRRRNKNGSEASYNQTSAKLLADWELAGLFDEHRGKPKTSIGIAALPANHILNFEVGDRSVVVELYDAILTAQLACILKNVLVETRLPNPADLTIVSREEEFSLYENGVTATETLSRDEARFLVIRRIEEKLLGSNRVTAVLHASAVAKNGRCVILSGESGRGKTTTALGLIHAGCIQVADDHVALDKNGEDILAFPTAIGTKSGIWDLAETANLLGTSAEATKVRDHVRYVHALEQANPGERFPVAAIVLPHFDSASKFELESISPEEALIELIAAGARPSQGLKTIAPLVHLLNTTPIYIMRYNSSDQSVPACLSLLEG